jgi:hypothetical protein
MTLEEMNRFRELSKQGNGTIPKRISILEEHNQMIQREISKLYETQKIIEYKMSHYREYITITRQKEMNEKLKKLFN